MVQYYYDKFTAIANTPYVLSESAGSSESTWDKNYDTKTYLTNVVEIGYTFDDTFASMARATSGGGVELVLPFSIYTDGLTLSRIFNKLAGTEAYGDCHVYVQATNSRAIYKLTINRWAYDAPSYSVKFGRITAVAGTTTYSKGALVQSAIPAEDGTYPANGRHTDGYWYVKGAAVGPLPPGTVINQPYSTAGNGGRKLVKLTNGTLVAVVMTNNKGYALYRKEINDTWVQIAKDEGYTGGIQDVSITTVGVDDVVGVLFAVGNSIVYFQKYKVSTGGLVDPKKTIDSSQTALGNASLAIDPTNGHLHAVWASKNTTNPNSSNIRYAKSVDGGVTWGTVSTLTGNNTSGVNWSSPSIVIRNNIPVILVSHTNSPSSVNYIESLRLDGSSWIGSRVYNGGPYGQLYPSAVVDKDGVIHVAWHGLDSTHTATNYIRYSKSTDGGLTWSVMQKLYGGSFPSISTDNTGRLTITYLAHGGGINLINSNDKGLTWTIYPATIANGSNPSTLYDTSLVGVFGDIPPTVFQTTTGVENTGTYTTNNAPTVSLTSPSTNQTLYENDTINITGDAYDADKDQSVTVYYQINNEGRKVLATNLSQTQISLSKQLTFKGGKIYDGETALTGILADGVAHTLKVWAEDSEKASSAIVERTFYVVPNRAPLLSVDTVVTSGVVDADKFKISGTASDQDANSTVKVTRRINSGNAVEIYSGAGGAWEFEIALSQLVVGQNTIIIEVVDNYGAKTSKTIQLDKDEVKTPILQSVARYKITPPSGSAKGVLLFIERDEELDLIVELSMTLAGEQEQYISLTPDNTAPMPNSNGIVEDTYYHETTEPKDNIIVKLSTTRPDATANHKIHLISGAVE